MIATEGYSSSEVPNREPLPSLMSESCEVSMIITTRKMARQGYVKLKSSKCPVGSADVGVTLLATLDAVSHM